MLSIADIVESVAFPYTVWRTLRGVEVEMCGAHPLYVTGNAAVTFRVSVDGHRKALKCYLRKNDRLEVIYGSSYLRNELCVVDMVGRYHWVDCLVMDYVEGKTLDEALCEATEPGQYAALAAAFDTFAGELLSLPRAHGDLKPENIIVTADGSMRAIDWDAAFVPSLAGSVAKEIGTGAYQHPLRDRQMYDKHIDDYSIAFLSTMLHMMSISEPWADYYRQLHEPLYMPKEFIGYASRERREALEQVLRLFAQRGMARSYRIAQLLNSPRPYIADLERIITSAWQSPEPGVETTLEWGEHGWWGCRCGQRWVVPPLYTSGFEPVGGYALMELEGFAHLLRLDSGETLYSFDEGVRVAMLGDGRLRIREQDTPQRIIEIEELINSSKKSIFAK